MIPAQTGMILRKLEKMEAAQTAQAKQIKALERQLDATRNELAKVRRTESKHLTIAESMQSRIDATDKMVGQLIRRG